MNEAEQLWIVPSLEIENEPRMSKSHVLSLHAHTFYVYEFCRWHLGERNLC